MTATEADWRPYRVIARKVESETIVSLDLAPADGSPPPPFRPGQYLTFRFADRAGEPTQRTYSISSDPADGTRRRISVKREPGGVGLRDAGAGRAAGRGAGVLGLFRGSLGD